MSVVKKLLIPGAVGVAAFAGVAGGSLLNAVGANADTTSGSTSSSTTQATSTQPDPSKGGHVGTNGSKEELLTGDAATKAKAAAEAAAAGATVLRVETDAEGATYEAHMKKSDGTMVTIKMDADFKVTGTEIGFGPGPSSSSSSSSSTNN